jgi:glycosyltransferase involved in cell wall biosynthesis
MTTFEIATSVAFWLCVSGVVYAYIGYPVVVWILAAACGRRREAPPARAGQVPFVSVLITAHNEEAVIADRITNALAFDYPANGFEVVVASDGSTDRTVDIAREIRDSRVRLFDFSRRRGKARVLNEVIPALDSEIVILSDANTSVAAAAARRFVQWFRDESVAVVVGRLVLTDPKTGRNVDSLYWRYETFLKQMDARLNALLGANGAIYALRRSLFVPMPEDTLVDDLVLPLLIRLHTGRDIVYDRTIVAHEETPADMGSEFKRRSRIGAGGFQSLSALWPLLSPARGWIAFTFVSHKVLRWLCPFLLVGAVLMNMLLLGHAGYRLTFAMQTALYAMAAAGSVVPGSGVAARLLRLATLFTSMNVALLAGFCQWAAGIRSGAWERTARPAAAITSATLTESTIRVVHLVIALDIGGLEMVVASLAKQIRRRFQLHVICLEGLGPVALQFQHAGVPIECIGHAETSIARSVIRLRRRLKALRPDVIHTHNEKAHIRGALATLVWLRCPALVHTRHGRSQVSGWLARLANRLAIWRSGYIVSVSQDASTVARAEGAQPERIRVIRNGVDIGDDGAAIADAHGPMRAVAVGRLTPVKDVGTLLRAARMVADVHRDFHLDVVGDGPSRPSLEALRRELNLEPHVTFQGAAHDVRSFLTGAALFVQSSISEGLSLTLLEAMASGLPIVATRVGGTPEAVEHGVTGILVPPQDPDALANAMLTVLNDRALARWMGGLARARAERLFSAQQMTASYEALYEQALARPGVRPAKEVRHACA